MSHKRVIPLYHDTKFPMTDAGLLDVRVRRFSVRESIDFYRRYRAVADRDSVRRLSVRKPGEEMEKRPIVRPRTATEQALAEALSGVESQGLLATVPDAIRSAVEPILRLAAVLVTEPSDAEEFVIDLEEIRRRRRAELTPAERAALESQEQAEDAAEAAFIAEVIARDVTLAPGQVATVDAAGVEADITTGADVLRLFGNRPDDLRALVQVVHMENALTDERKKAYRSLFDSSASSTEATPPAAGSATAPTAEAVAPTDSGTSAAATALPVM